MSRAAGAICNWMSVPVKVESSLIHSLLRPSAMPLRSDMPRFLKILVNIPLGEKIEVISENIDKRLYEQNRTDGWMNERTKNMFKVCGRGVTLKSNKPRIY